MSRERVELHGEQRTMLMTLYLHARDARSAQPILDDQFAAEALDRVDSDLREFEGLAGNLPLIMGRAKAIDDVARSFLDEHADAVVLHLGCGLDNRAARLDPGPSVAWFDVDQQPVIDLRRRVLDDRTGVTTVAASVTETQWWSAVPTRRPTLVIGEGLLMYLDTGGVRTLLDAVLTHGRSNEQTTLVFDTVARWVLRVSGWQPSFRRAGTKFRSTHEDLDAAAERHDDLVLAAEQSLVTLARRVARGPLAPLLGAVDAIGPGHRSMILRTYRHRPRTAQPDREPITGPG